jgi:SAM-dependent methyltransferase
MKAGPVRFFRRRLLERARALLPLPRTDRLARHLPSVYLRGVGCEIGALHNPLRVPACAQVKYVDRMPVGKLREQYPELKDTALVPVDIVTNGETLEGIADASMDFVIARNFLEHCEDPIGTVATFLRVLVPGGIVYLGIPDKRHTFDRDRPLTTLAHLIDDHEHGAGRSRRAHFEEVARFTSGAQSDSEVRRIADDLMARDYSIHYHVWSQRELLELMLYLGERLGFEIEATCKNGTEVVFVLRKNKTDRPRGEPASCISLFDK